MRHRVELEERGLHIRRTEADIGALIAHLVTVIRRAEQSNTLSIVVDRVAIRCTIHKQKAAW